MENYRGDQILRVAVPQWNRTSDGQWSREWALRLVDAPSADARRKLSELSEDGIRVVAEFEDDGRTIRLRTTTDRNAHSDEIFFAAAYRMLRRVDEEVGRIESIQGQPRDWWQPFREPSPDPSTA